MNECIVSLQPLQHTIPCVGFVVHEKDRVGALNPSKIESIVQQNKDELRKLPFLRRSHMKIYAHLKTLGLNEVFTFPDGTEVKVSDVVEPPKKGRKLVILGDTCSGERIVKLAMDATMVVHEATNAWMREIDGDKFPTAQAMERETFNHGHSTPQMGDFLQY